MTAGQIFYSDDLRCAYLAEIVRLHEEIHADQYLGRTAMQKLAYFCQVLGVPVPCRFNIYTYGPYTEEITFAVESMLADGVIEDRSSNPKYSNYRTASVAEELLAKYRHEVEPHHDRILSVVKALGSGEPRDLELISTLHFVAERQRKIGGDSNKDKIISEFLKIKNDKFHRDDVGRWYDKLSRAGLIR